jgi:hypothetical protein
MDPTKPFCTPVAGYVSPNHTSQIFNAWEFQTLVDKIAERMVLLHNKHPFDAIAGSGNSGQPLLGALSYKTGIPIISVRKSKDSNHDSSLANGYLNARTYLIIDDLIDTGTTIKRIISSIRTEQQTQRTYGTVKCVGVPVAILLYTGGTGCGNSYFVAGDQKIPTYELCRNNLDIAPGSRIVR